jgi:hypothetical protein
MDHPMLLRHAPSHPAFGSTTWLNVMAVVAVGMFIGTWILGPAISSGPTEYAKLRSATEEKARFESAMARPDPSPYRYPTPAFDMSNGPSYGKIAKQRAQAMYGRGGGDGVRVSQSNAIGEAFGSLNWQDSDTAHRPAPAPSGRYQQRDRHTGVTY